MMKLLDLIFNIILGSVCSFGLALVIYNCIHSDGSAWSAIYSMLILGFGIGLIIFWNKD